MVLDEFGPGTSAKVEMEIEPPVLPEPPARDTSPEYNQKMAVFQSVHPDTPEMTRTAAAIRIAFKAALIDCPTELQPIFDIMRRIDPVQAAEITDTVLLMDVRDQMAAEGSLPKPPTPPSNRGEEDAEDGKA